MASNYPAQSAGTIGALLRAIQEERQQNPISAPPSTDTGSPIRQLIAPPVMQSEAPDSSRVISVRPEGQGIEQGKVIPPAAPVLPPSAPAAPIAPVGPSAPSSPASRPTAPSAPSAPSAPAPRGIGTVLSAATVKGPPATVKGPPAGYRAPATSTLSAPKTSRIGGAPALTIGRVGARAGGVGIANPNYNTEQSYVDNLRRMLPFGLGQKLFGK